MGRCLLSAIAQIVGLTRAIDAIDTGRSKCAHVDARGSALQHIQAHASQRMHTCKAKKKVCLLKVLSAGWLSSASRSPL
jgi:hypothetical protein